MQFDRIQSVPFWRRLLQSILQAYTHVACSLWDYHCHVEIFRCTVFMCLMGCYIFAPNSRCRVQIEVKFIQIVTTEMRSSQDVIHHHMFRRLYIYVYIYIYIHTCFGVKGKNQTLNQNFTYHQHLGSSFASKILKNGTRYYQPQQWRLLDFASVPTKANQFAAQPTLLPEYVLIYIHITTSYRCTWLSFNIRLCNHIFRLFRHLHDTILSYYL